MTLPVSVIMISLNEAHHMPAVLKNLEGFAEKVFLVDSFSADDTVDIAVRHGVHVVQRRFRDFGDQWNFAVNELPIETPWVMKLDPDERITDELKQSIAQAIEGDRLDGIGFERRLWLMGKPMPVRNHVLRLWRHGNCRFTDVIVNEHPVINGGVGDIAGELEHHDSPNLHHWFDKQNRYTTAEAIAQFQRHSLADAPRLFGTRLQRRMWLKQHFWKLPGRFTALHLYLVFWTGAWRAGKVGLIWARLRTELYRSQEFKYFEMTLSGAPYQTISSGHGAPHPEAVQAPDPNPQFQKSRQGMNGAKADPGAVNHHEHLADGWESRYASGGFQRRARFIRDELFAPLDIDGRWLDAGCGSGLFARMLAERGAEVRGVDAAEGMVEAARHLALDHTAMNRLTFETINTVEDLPDADQSYDGVISMSVLEYLPNPGAALREFARILRPGGTVVISLPNTRSPTRLLGKAKAVLAPEKNKGTAFLDHSRFTLKKSAVAPFFERHGFRVAAIKGFDPIMPKGLGTKAPSLFFVTATRQ
ncbi:MAG: methyltransferase domain-containing protein [Pseudomonadota bacterium]